MLKRLVGLMVLLACFLAPRTGLGQLIGEPAPPLVVKDWAIGGPVEVKAGTNIFVVAIWQTALPSVQAVVTNFNQVQNRYKTNGVVVVGICDEPVGALRKFVLHDFTNVQFAVAADDTRKTSFGYMNPINQRGIPYEFIVGTNGIVLWHGWGGLEGALDRVIAGKLDLDLEKKNETARHQMRQYLELIQRGDARAGAAGRTLLINRTNDVPLLCSMAIEIITVPAPKHDFVLANEALKQAEHLQPTNNNQVMFARAVYLYETGRRTAGLMQATQALAVATSPMDKAVIESGIQTMKSRWETYQLLQSKANHLGGTNAPAEANRPGRTTDVETNHIAAPAGNP